MTAPMPAETLSAQLDAVDALAAELVALSAALADDAELCLSTAASLSAALSGDEGWAARTAAAGWTSLTDVVAGRCAAVAGTLAAAVASYRAADAALSDRIGSGRHDARFEP
jgi:hypothetical protein